MSLTIKCSDIAQTRATEAGEDAYNENEIDRLDVFFYAAGATADADAIYRMTLTSLNATGSYTYDQRIETTVIETIFGTGANAGTQAKIYAIANLPAGITVSDNASVNELKATAIETAALAGTVKQDNFVMDSKGDDVVTYNSATRGITGEIKLYRAASKIALFITEVNSVPVTDADGNVQKDAQGNDIMWTANTNGMMVRLNNGVKKTHLDNTVSPYTVVTDDYFSFASGKERKMVADGSQWKQELPFYSYSSDWSADGKDKEAYLTLIVPWQKSDAPGVYHNTYYQVPINGLTEDLIRNNYYKISLKVSRLGTFTEGDAVTITPGTYIILNWTTNTIDADMLDYRYLVVDQKEYTIYNQEELYIPFASSHETEIVSVTCTQEDLSTVGADPKAVTGYTLTRNDVTKLIHFQNDLENDMSKNDFDFTPITLTFTIQHEDDDDYKEVIKVIQYPAIYAEANMNSDYASGGANDGVTGIGGTKGFVWVNGYNSSGGSNPTGNSFFGTVHGIHNYDDDEEQITNPNMYVLTITSVEGTDYVVGDPRVYENATTFINNYDWCPAPYFTNNSVSSNQNHELTYYYPTDYTNRTYNMIAPKFRVASAYSVTIATGVTDINVAKGRCASYQEDGYPAGRWRMPTKAEYEFIVYQSYKGRIPTLFQSNTDYWCAHGYGQPNSQGKVTMNGNVNATTGNLTLQGGASIRCVYDEWYWEDYLQGKDKIPFTWGDMPR